MKNALTKYFDIERAVPKRTFFPNTKSSTSMEHSDNSEQFRTIHIHASNTIHIYLLAEFQPSMAQYGVYFEGARNHNFAGQFVPSEKSISNSFELDCYVFYQTLKYCVYHPFFSRNLKSNHIIFHINSSFLYDFIREPPKEINAFYVYHKKIQTLLSMIHSYAIEYEPYTPSGSIGTSSGFTEALQLFPVPDS
jgi:hypothetical protein